MWPNMYSDNPSLSKHGLVSPSTGMLWRLKRFLCNVVEFQFCPSTPGSNPTKAKPQSSHTWRAGTSKNWTQFGIMNLQHLAMSSPLLVQ